FEKSDSSRCNLLRRAYREKLFFGSNKVLDGGDQCVSRANIVDIALRLNQVFETVIKGLFFFTHRRLAYLHSMDGLVAIW
ncbi:MAG: hypothetical protein EBR82_33775, partial [Caulobacteraceae bacterium]|nr:hypothetical protein [Caulobacteraceae bacterium]